LEPESDSCKSAAGSVVAQLESANIRRASDYFRF